MFPESLRTNTTIHYGKPKDQTILQRVTWLPPRYLASAVEKTRYMLWRCLYTRCERCSCPRRSRQADSRIQMCLLLCCAEVDQLPLHVGSPSITQPYSLLAGSEPVPGGNRASIPQRHCIKTFSLHVHPARLRAIASPLMAT